MTMKVYECENTACTLGTRGTPGRFSGGATKEQITNITGDPEPENFGDGVCPNCGEKGALVSSTVPPLGKGKDPHQELHDKIGGETQLRVAKLGVRVADPEDDMTAEDAKDEIRSMTDEAQEKLNRAVERKEAADNAS